VLQTLLKKRSSHSKIRRADAKLYRALYHTYLRPRPRKSRRAELLDLPFSTFRRHLKAGIIRVAESLWQKELADWTNEQLMSTFGLETEHPTVVHCGCLEDDSRSCFLT